MKRYCIRKIEILDWKINWLETRMGWYNINAERVSGNKIGIDGVTYDEGTERIVSDVINFELSLNRTNSYWNNVFQKLLEVNKIPFENDLIFDNPNKHFSSWSIEILEDIYLSFSSDENVVQLTKNKDLIASINWNDFNGTKFYKLIQSINFRF